MSELDNIAESNNLEELYQTVLHQLNQQQKDLDQLKAENRELLHKIHDLDEELDYINRSFTIRLLFVCIIISAILALAILKIF